MKKDQSKDILNVVGCASGLGGVDVSCGEGPLHMQKSPYLTPADGWRWVEMIQPRNPQSSPLDKSILDVCSRLADSVSNVLKQERQVLVLGGDHTCAIGTWSGVYDAKHQSGDIGLIWIDAHMDSHSPQTSETGRLHGMPLACLLGEGASEFTSILHSSAKIKPENLCLIGIRSFEQGEAALLRSKHVRIFYMDEVKQRGFVEVLKEAIAIVSKNTIGYGISIDIDCMDPIEAPGVDVPEPDGIHAKDLLNGIALIQSDPNMIATEIVEFDPARDQDAKTEKLVASLIRIIAGKEYDQT